MIKNAAESLQERAGKVKEPGIDKLKYGAMLDDAYQKIKEMMYNNQLIPGQKIIYGDLADRLNTSVTPIIQALKRLESSKIVRYFPNKGYFVTEITEAELRELYEARESLELFILPKITRNMSPDAIASVRDHFRKLDLSDPRKWVFHDKHFHLKIAEYARNDVIYHLLEEILERIYLRYKPQYLGEKRLKEALREHREILESIGGGNVKKVRNVIRKHIYHQLDYTIRYMLK
jgi:DNA-binding GntR family transcriptional regulator